MYPLASLLNCSKYTSSELNHTNWVNIELMPTKEEQIAFSDKINNRPSKGLGVRSKLSVYGQILAKAYQHFTGIYTS